MASQFAAAAFRVVTAPGESVVISIGGRTAPMRTAPIDPMALTNFVWIRASALALITASRERLDPLLSVDPDDFTSEWDLPVHHAYHVALRAYLRGEPSRTAMNRALNAAEDIRMNRPDFLGPFAVLLSQLVAGDREGLVAALADALEEFRDHYSVGDRKDDSTRQVHLGVLALTCHARWDLGWEIPVNSAYLPTAILEAGPRDR
ncbi:Immunity protein 49 [Thermomonospora echinospora]|uniref:Immunity protein 49 n=1 Tax=Thermomonospora echinospora TaxID=1992 RepID=A0A1H6E3X7_9ACTN|nr:Immunity protein 49 [Thermomonospora echinospora]